MTGRSGQAHLSRLNSALSRLLIDSVSHSIPLCMRRIFDMDDRARLRERFFGASLTVLARL